MNPDNLPTLLLTFALLFILGALTGCGGTRYGTAQITSIPAGAEVVNLKDDTHLGITPLMVTWEGNDDEAIRATVELRKSGYVEAIKSFWIKMYKTKEEADQKPQPVTVELKKKD